MSKKLILVLVVASFFSGFNLARAEVVINEIMYAPANGSDYEWVEIFNSGSNSIDLNNYRFFHGETNSGPLTLRNGSTAILQPSGYAIIAKSPSVVTDYNWLNFSGMILSASTVSLPDSGDNTYIAISDPDKVIIDHVTYDTSLGGSKESGNSLQLINGSWVGSTPSPGTANEIVSPPPDDDSSSSGSSSSSSSGSSASTTTTTSSEPKPKVIENPTMKAKILANALAFSGQPLEIKTTVSGFSNENVVLGRAYWNFGDGGSLEQINNFEKFYHTYYYPGEYVLFLEYYQNSFSKTPEATGKMIIKVLATTVTISKVGDAKDFFTELSNNASSDIDISNWVINANGKTFILPKNSVIMSKKQMTISGKITGFIYGDQSNLKLYSGTGELVFDYSSPIEPIKILAKNSVPVKISTAFQPLEVATPVSDEQIPTENLLASAQGNGILQQDGKSSDLSPIIPLASIVFIGAGAGAVYFIRQKKIIPQVGNDFEILDE